jgi:hypothetical protein
VTACKRICHPINGFDRAGELLDAIGQNGTSVVEHLGRITGYTTGIAFFGHNVAETKQDVLALIGAASASRVDGICSLRARDLMSESGTNRTCRDGLAMSASGGRADIPFGWAEVR